MEFSLDNSYGIMTDCNSPWLPGYCSLGHFAARHRHCLPPLGTTADALPWRQAPTRPVPAPPIGRAAQRCLLIGPKVSAAPLGQMSTNKIFFPLPIGIL